MVRGYSELLKPVQPYIQIQYIRGKQRLCNSNRLEGQYVV